jgi:enoyl-CoA hydratase
MELVRVSEDAGVVTLTIDRPKALNALDASVLEALGSAAATIAKNDNVRVVILTGAGEKAFVAGADIKAMADMSPTEARRFSEKGHQVFAAIEALPVPVIAAVNGFALGGGLELALAADLIHASDNAKFGQPEVNLGLIPGFGGCVRLARRVGLQNATDLILSGDTIDAAKARAIGLVVAVHTQADLMAEVNKVAQKIANRGPLAIRAAKRLLRRTLEVDQQTAQALEQQEFAALFSSRDQREGCKAFMEKRAAQFVGA